MVEHSKEEVQQLVKLGTKHITPAVRAWIRRTVFDIFDEELKSKVNERIDQISHYAFQGVQMALNDFTKMLQGISTRSETLYHAAQKFAVVSPEQLEEAYQDLMTYQDEIRRLLTLDYPERLKGLLAWKEKGSESNNQSSNKHEGQIQIKPGELMLHEYVLDTENELTPEERWSFAEEAGFSEDSIEKMKTEFERRLEVKSKTNTPETA